MVFGYILHLLVPHVPPVPCLSSPSCLRHAGCATLGLCSLSIAAHGQDRHEDRNKVPSQVVPAPAYSSHSRTTWNQGLRAVPGLFPGAVHVPGKERKTQMVLWCYSRICSANRICPGKPRNFVRDDRWPRKLYLCGKGTVAGPWLQRQEQHGQG